jgi:subtilisin family serine protease
MVKTRICGARSRVFLAASALLLSLTYARAGEGVDPNASFKPAQPSAPQAPSSPNEPKRTSPSQAERRQAVHKPVKAETAASHAHAPAAGETRFRADEAVVEFSARTPAAAIDAVRRRHRLDEIETTRTVLIGDDLRLWRAADGRSALAILRELGGEPLVVSAQPNYVYALQQATDAARPAVATQYALGKLKVDAARSLASGDKVLVAMVDSGVDESHPDLQGAIAAKTDTIGGASSTLDHGTSIAGAIGARGAVEGVAPKARILSVRAFEATPSGPQGTTLSIVRGIDWAVTAQAKIVNMSFAGPPDPDVLRIVAAANAKGVILIAAAGNAGPTSPPLYPAADAGVVAVTAIDSDDKLFESANRGRYISVSAPGVDVLLPVANGGYDLKSGTSVAAALVSGVAALMLEHNPALRPDALKKTLTSTARPLAAAGHEAEFGAGLVDAMRALGADKPTAKAP